MNEKNTKILLTDFPELYAGVHDDVFHSLMSFGFMCGDGWYDLIYSLSEKLSKLSPIPKALEVKEKFGGLRFYLDGWSSKGEILILEAMKKSFTICENCGKKGKLRDNLSCIQTLCEQHYKEAKKRKKGD